MRVLIITKLYPNRAQPLAAAFNRQQFGALAELCDVEIVVPRPWFPGAGAVAGKTDVGKLAKVPLRDRVDGRTVRYPRALHIPRLGRPLAGLFTAASLWPLIRTYRGWADVVLGSWAYPHGVAAIAMAKRLGVPSVVKTHGSDINVLATMTGLREQLAWQLPRATRVVAVSRALANSVEALGVPRSRIDLVYNGVDKTVFYPRDRQGARAALKRNPAEKLIVFVGWLLATKGVLDLRDAFAAVRTRHPSAALAIIGDGPEKPALDAWAAREPNVTLLGARPLPEVAQWIGAADVLTLPSWAEGTPNVVLEALASGRRVVATSVGGIPDLIHDPRLGAVVPAQNAAALAEALSGALETSYDPKVVADLGSRGSWADSAAELLASLRRATEQS